VAAASLLNVRGHPEASADQSSARRYLVLALKIVVSIVLLSLLFSKIDVARLWAIARRASLRWFAVALAIYAVNMIASTWRWHLLLRAQEVNVRRRWLLARSWSPASSTIFCRATSAAT
jgi:uncharacterized membrane protein YbhN (UPF0104 family)